MAGSLLSLKSTGTLKFCPAKIQYSTCPLLYRLALSQRMNSCLRLKHIRGIKTICMDGYVALNCVWVTMTHTQTLGTKYRLSWHFKCTIQQIECAKCHPVISLCCEHQLVACSSCVDVKKFMLLSNSSWTGLHEWKTSKCSIYIVKLSP